MGIFVRVDCNFYSHRKTIRLRSVLGDDALWIPPRLWAYAAENQADGNFADYSAEEIAIAIGYSKDAPSMLQALLQAQFMDADKKIHDWMEHNGYHQAHKQRASKAANERWKLQREKKNLEEKRSEERRGEERGIAPSNAPSIPEAMLQASAKHQNDAHEAENGGGTEILCFEQVKSAVMTHGIPDDFVHWVYDDWVGRAGRDGAGVGVEIVGYVRKRWAREQTEWRSGTHKGKQKTEGTSQPAHRAESRAREFPQTIKAKRL